jgi:hypothetical protein
MAGEITQLRRHITENLLSGLPSMGRLANTHVRFGVVELLIGYSRIVLG